MNAPSPSAVVPWTGLSDEIANLWSLGWPVVLGSLGMVLMYSVDTAMVGHLGENALGSVAMGHLWASAFGLVGRSVIHGLDPVVSQAFGANDREAAGDALLRGFQVAILASVPVILVYGLAGPGLRLLWQPAELIPDAQVYIGILRWGVVPMMVFWALRQWLQGLGMMRPATWIVLAANVLNVALNAVLIYGAFGWEGAGVRGAAWATVLSQTAMCVALIWLVWPEIRAWWPARPRWRDHGPLLHVLGIGVPVCLQIGLEVWAFNGGSVLMGWLGKTEVGAHSIALNLASVAFMVPLGISAAAATRVGNLIGAGHRWQESGWVAIGFGAAVMTVSGALFLAFPHALASLFTDSVPVVALAAALIPYASFFGLFDGIQAVAFGVLRGAGDVRLPSLFNVLAYWVIGLPLGWWLAFRMEWGAFGVWSAIVVSLATVASLLLVRVVITGRRGGYRVVHQASAS